MRLLRWLPDGELILTKDLTDDIPSYAILSHTWGADDEEVNFDDLKTKNWRNKAGYDKIRFCGQQARKDGLRYFWIDTCCIDKANHAELSEALISMFGWYRNAVKCYVYLSDVVSPIREDGTVRNDWKFDFSYSRWFLRGWTLQELLAPTIVEFFSREGQPLGDRNSLEQLIHQTTQIPLEALQGSLLASFSVAERMRWAAERQTKRKEDQAYCLFGIFGIYLPVLYGEGDNAFIRLEEEIMRSLNRSLNNSLYSPARIQEYQSTNHYPPFPTDARLAPGYQLSMESSPENKRIAPDRASSSTYRPALQASLIGRPMEIASDRLHTFATGVSLTDGFSKVINRNGFLTLRAQLPHPAVEDIERVVRDVLDGYLHEYEQELVLLSQRRFRGWVADNIKQLHETPLGSMLSELQLAFLDRKSLQVDGMRDCGLIENCDVSEYEVGSDRDLMIFESSQSRADAIRQSCDSFPCETRTIRRGNRLGFLVLRLQRIGSWLKVFLLFQPARFISRGLDISYEISFDGRGFPRIRNGGLQLYGVIPEDDDILDFIMDGSVHGLREALMSRRVSVNDRFCENGFTLLHKCTSFGQSQLCTELLKWGAGTSAVDRHGGTPLEALLNDHFWHSMINSNLSLQHSRHCGSLTLNEFRKSKAFSQLAADIAASLPLLALAKRTERPAMEWMKHAIIWLKMVHSEVVNLNQHMFNDIPFIIQWMTILAQNPEDVIMLENHSHSNSKSLSFLDKTLSWMMVILSAGANPSNSDSKGVNPLHLWLQIWFNTVDHHLEDTRTQSDSDIGSFCNLLSEGLTILCCFGANIYAADHEGWDPHTFAKSCGCELIWKSVLWFCGYTLDLTTEIPVHQSQTSSAQTSHSDPPVGGATRRRRTYVYDDGCDTTDGFEDKSQFLRLCRLRPESQEFVSHLPLAAKLSRHQNCSSSCHERLMQEWTPTTRDVFLGRHLATTGALNGSPVYQWYDQWDWEDIASDTEHDDEESSAEEAEVDS